ncbi:PAS domain S-box protein [Desulfovibrio inopinatus]|uniref:PAS domain S-box protein n=1 Tax=Desulfovibrio inopinatus TaxID=102109 RepID=UPI0006844717|nr:PAS domain S-box protein [Desulfovibrio inopinatus]
MSIRTKMLAFLLPLVTLFITGFGFWATQTANSGIQASLQSHLYTALDGYIATSIEPKHAFLLESGLDQVQPFVKQYQEDAAAQSSEVPLPEAGRILIFTQDGHLVFDSLGRPNDEVKAAWDSEIPAIIDNYGQHQLKEHDVNDTLHIYTARQFLPWKWVIIATVPKDIFFKIPERIYHMTLTFTVVCVLCVTILIVLFFRRVILRPTDILMRAARDIAERRKREPIPLKSNDELGRLARIMESLWKDIKDNETELAQWQKSMEERVMDRTRELSRKTEELEREIVERVQLEKYLSESEKLYRDLFELGLIGMAVTDPVDKQWIEVNDRLCEMLGYSPEELKSMSWTDITHPEDLENDIKLFERLLAGRLDGYVVEKRFVKKDGSIIFTTMTMRSDRNGMNGIRHIYVLIHDITDRVLAEKHLAQNQIVLKNVFDAAEMGICVLNDKLIILEANETFFALFNLSRDTIGTALSALAIDQSLDNIMHVASVALNQDDVVAGEAAIQTKEKAARRLELRGYPLKETGGDAAVALMVRDITAQKDVEAALAERLTFIQTLMDAIPSPIFYKDARGVFQGCNAAFERFFNIPSSKVVGRTIFDLAPADLAQEYHEHDRALLHEGGIQVYESKVQRPDGTRTDVIFTKSKYSNPLGEQSGIIGVIVEIEERKRMEEALRESEHLLSIILDGIKAAFVIIDSTSGLVLQANDVAAEILGKPRSSIENQYMNEAMAGYGHLGNTTCQEGTTCLDKETTFTRPDGEIIPIRRSCFPVTVAGQDCTAEIFFDVTERKALERQLAYAQKLESIGQLAAGIAHEINTPTQFIGDNIRFLDRAHSTLSSLLDTLLAFVEKTAPFEALQTDRADIEQATKKAKLKFLRQEIPLALSQSREGVGRVAAIVAGMRKFSHPGTDEMQPVDVNAAVENTVLIAKNEWKYVADVVTNLDPDLPLVTCLAGDFNQVVLNLLVNAAQAVGDVVKNGEKGTITISTSSKDEFMVMTVSDSGVGIPEENRDKIFNPFFTTKDVGKGTGQGLAIIQNIVVKKHEGRIDFTSEEGNGTTFIVMLPFAGKR